jgi:DNA-binding NtrC family response regulator
LTVPDSILIIESTRQSSENRDELRAVFEAWNSPTYTTWDSFAPSHLSALENRLVIANAAQSDEKASAFFSWLRDHSAPVPIFAILPGQDSSLWRTAMETVDDFVFAPIRAEELACRIARFLGSQSPDLSAIHTALAAEMGLKQFVGRDPVFLKVVDQIARAASHDAPVLLTGETGTGKELCARVTHLLSKRQTAPFIPVDCGALPDHLFENELFGHARGAFTDARTDQKGLVALAQGGTLFLDEVDSLTLSAQGKLLRLLQESTYRPLGSEVFKRADVRIVTATNRNLQELVEQKLFRADLYFRIHVLHIHLPSLRERRSDIELLSRHFIDEICRSTDVPRKTLSFGAARKLERYDWPGNIRELYNILQCAVLSSPAEQIPAGAINVGDSVIDMPESPGEVMTEEFRSAKLRAIQCFEREYVHRMLHKHAGNVTRAAREAGKDRRAFGRLVKKYGSSVGLSMVGQDGPLAGRE